MARVPTREVLPRTPDILRLDLSVPEIYRHMKGFGALKLDPLSLVGVPEFVGPTDIFQLSAIPLDVDTIGTSADTTAANFIPESTIPRFQLSGIFSAAAPKTGSVALHTSLARGIAALFRPLRTLQGAMQDAMELGGLSFHFHGGDSIGGNTKQPTILVGGITTDLSTFRQILFAKPSLFKGIGGVLLDKFGSVTISKERRRVVASGMHNPFEKPPESHWTRVDLGFRRGITMKQHQESNRQDLDNNLYLPSRETIDALRLSLKWLFPDVTANLSSLAEHTREARMHTLGELLLYEQRLINVLYGLENLGTTTSEILAELFALDGAIRRLSDDGVDLDYRDKITTLIDPKLRASLLAEAE